MKQYYTLVQCWNPSYRSLGDYFDNQGIPYDLGADLVEELRPFGLKDPNVKDGDLLKTFKILLDEHELTAIQLSVDGVTIIQNRTDLKLKNKIRGYFSWILD